jgi:hypothetical protein
MAAFIDASIHKGVNLDEIIGCNVVTRNPSSHYFYGVKNFIRTKPELVPFVVSASGDMDSYNIIYKYKGQVWNRIFHYGSIAYQNVIDLNDIYDIYDECEHDVKKSSQSDDCKSSKT